MKMLLAKTSYAQISAMLEVGCRIIKDAKDDMVCSREIGRPREFTDNIMEFLETEWLNDATVSDADMSVPVQKRFNQKFKRQTLSNARNMLGFGFRPRFTIQLMNDGHHEAGHLLRWNSRVDR
jgi:hypothetical protein